MDNGYFESKNFSKEDFIVLDKSFLGEHRYPPKSKVTEKLGVGVETIRIIRNYMPAQDVSMIMHKLESIYARKHGDFEIINKANKIVNDYKDKIKITAEELFNIELEHDDYANQTHLPDSLLAGRKPNFVTGIHSDIIDVDKSKYGEYLWSHHISNLLYLNDNYSGGEIYFPEHDLLIKPEPGMLVSFPGHFWNRHGILPASEYRFAMSLFLKIKDFE
jgi:hypothetical protein